MFPATSLTTIKTALHACARPITLAAFGVLAVACASRSLPAQFPPSSAASLTAPEAPPAAVTTTLSDHDPPPPDLPAADPHAHHRGGHHVP